MHSLNILFNADAQAKETILAWAKKKNFSNPAFIVEDTSNLATDFPYPIFFLRDLILMGTSTEEFIYRSWAHYRKFFAQKFPLSYKGVNLLTDELRNYSFELPMLYLMAYLKVTQTPLDLVSPIKAQTPSTQVIIMISSPAIYLRILFQSLLHTITSNSLGALDESLIFDKKKSAFIKTKTSFYQYHGKYFWYEKILFVKNNIQFTRKLVISFFKKKQKTNISDKSIVYSSSQPLVFVTSPSALYRNNFLPIYQSLSQKTQRYPFLIATPESEKTASEDNIVFISLKKEMFKLMFSPRIIINIAKHVFCWIIFKNIYLLKLKYRQTNKPWENFFFHQLKTFLSKNGLILRLIKSSLYTHYIEQILIKNKPSVIYKDVSCSSLDARIGTLAQVHQIPVVTSVVASITSSYRNFAIYPCDFITLLGENQIPTFIKRGFAESQLICAGQPELDNIKRTYDLKSAIDYLSSVISNYRSHIPTLLIATGYFNLDKEKIWIKHICEYASRRSQPIQILIKPHPSVYRFYESFRSLPHLSVLSSTASLYPCLIAADLVFTDVSHAGKLAIFFRKPLVVVNFCDKKYPFNNFDEEGVAWIAHNAHELESIIEDVCSGRKSIEDSAYNDYIEQHFTKDDGKASERIADFLLSF